VERDTKTCFLQQTMLTKSRIEHLFYVTLQYITNGSLLAVEPTFVLEITQMCRAGLIRSFARR